MARTSYDRLVEHADELTEKIVERVALDPDGAVTTVDYDDETGHPVFVDLDPDVGLEGDEWSFEVVQLVPPD